MMVELLTYWDAECFVKARRSHTFLLYGAWPVLLSHVVIVTIPGFKLQYPNACIIHIPT